MYVSGNYKYRVPIYPFLYHNLPIFALGIVSSSIHGIKQAVSVLASSLNKINFVKTAMKSN